MRISNSVALTPVLVFLVAAASAPRAPTTTAAKANAATKVRAAPPRTAASTANATSVDESAGIGSRNLPPLLVHIPEPIRFGAAGILGSVAFYVLDRALYNALLVEFGHIGGKEQRSAETVRNAAAAAVVATAAAAEGALSKTPKSGIERAKRAHTAPGSQKYGPTEGDLSTAAVLPPMTTSTSSSSSSGAALGSVSFVVAYILQIVFQHFLNALLVFGPSTIATRSLYFRSLVQTYVTYGTGLVVSTAAIIWMTKKGFSRNVAFWTVMNGVGVGNYLVLGWLNRRLERRRRAEVCEHLEGHGRAGERREKSNNLWDKRLPS